MRYFAYHDHLFGLFLTSRRPSDFSDQYRRKIREEATIYKRADLTEYENAVNVAAGELCISDISLLRDLLSKARKK